MELVLWVIICIRLRRHMKLKHADHHRLELVALELVEHRKVGCMRVDHRLELVALELVEHRMARYTIVDHIDGDHQRPMALERVRPVLQLEP